MELCMCICWRHLTQLLERSIAPSVSFEWVQRQMAGKPGRDAIHFKRRLDRRSDESRTIASALTLSCYIVDDVRRPNMAYTEYSLIILSHILLASTMTSREIFWSLLTFHSNQQFSIVWHKLASYLHWRIKSKQNLSCSNRCWPKKLAPCILSQDIGPGCKLQNILVPCWSYGGQYRHLTGPAASQMLHRNIVESTLCHLCNRSEQNKIFLLSMPNTRRLICLRKRFWEDLPLTTILVQVSIDQRPLTGPFDRLLDRFWIRKRFWEGIATVFYTGTGLYGPKLFVNPSSANTHKIPIRYNRNILTGDRHAIS
jgi:hypothetical protein